MKSAIMIVGTLGWTLAFSAFAGAINADIECRSAGSGPVYDCLIKLADLHTRAPVAGAKFTVSADMPSMPMAHNVKPVAAVPNGEPGAYRARLALEMPGTWNVKLRLSAPTQGQIVKKIDFFDAR